MADARVSFPVFVVEGLDVAVLAAPDDVYRVLEPCDVQANINKCYDSLGRRLQLETDGHEMWIRPLEDEPTGLADLAEVLRANLDLMISIAPGTTAEELVLLATKIMTR